MCFVVCDMLLMYDPTCCMLQALQQLSSVTVAKDKAIADGDKKLDILKQRISVAIEGKSMLFELRYFFVSCPNITDGCCL